MSGSAMVGSADLATRENPVLRLAPCHAPALCWPRAAHPMADDLGFILIAFPAILFVVDPFAALPIFATISAGDPIEKRRAMAARAAHATAITLALFAALGGLLFRPLGISMGAFKVAGGIMILLMALDMMRAQPSRTRSTAVEQAEGAEKDDVAIVPLAIPMLAGPGAMATVTVLMGRAGWRP